MPPSLCRWGTQGRNSGIPTRQHQQALQSQRRKRTSSASCKHPCYHERWTGAAAMDSETAVPRTRERRRAPSPSDAAPGNAPARAARGAAPRNVRMAPGKLGRRSPKAEATPRSRDEQIHKIRFVYTVKYYSALKREVFLFLFSILGFYWVFKISQVGLRGCLASE